MLTVQLYLLQQKQISSTSLIISKPVTMATYQIAGQETVLLRCNEAAGSQKGVVGV